MLLSNWTVRIFWAIFGRYVTLAASLRGFWVWCLIRIDWSLYHPDKKNDRIDFRELSWMLHLPFSYNSPWFCTTHYENLIIASTISNEYNRNTSSQFLFCLGRNPINLTKKCFLVSLYHQLVMAEASKVLCLGGTSYKHANIWYQTQIPNTQNLAGGRTIAVYPKQHIRAKKCW